MLTGVKIGDIDTLEDYSLALTEDLKVEEAKLKEAWIDVPGADGELNVSYAVSGGKPVYGMRNITFNLVSCAGATEEEMTGIRRELKAICHGKEEKIWLPDDPDHYFMALIRIGERSGYNRPIIPVQAKAYPWKNKNMVTTVEVTIPSAGTKTVTLTNEEKPVMPSFTTETAAVIIFGDVSHNIGEGTYSFEDIILDAGENTITVSGTAGNEVVIEYQEAVL